MLAAIGLVGFQQLDSEQDRQQSEIDAMANQISTLQTSVTKLGVTATALNKRIGRQEQTVSAGLAPLASRTLKSVYSIETADGSGSGWAAWSEDGATFVITANHVVEGFRTVAVRRKSSKWQGIVTRTDAVNDLALIRVDREIGTPMWANANVQPTPNVGDTLVLVGSPYGLEGTVTTGIVSRVTYNEIQTDAAANPGNSGGPAVDRQGRVVGVLLSGGGENLNFTVPIKRACITIRDC